MKKENTHFTPVTLEIYIALRAVTDPQLSEAMLMINGHQHCIICPSSVNEKGKLLNNLQITASLRNYICSHFVSIMQILTMLEHEHVHDFKYHNQHGNT